MVFTFFVSCSNSSFCLWASAFKGWITSLFPSMLSRQSCTWQMVRFFFSLWYNPIGNRLFLLTKGGSSLESSLQTNPWFNLLVPRFGALHLANLGRIYIKLKSYHFTFLTFDIKINFAIKTYLWGLSVQSNSPFSCPNMLRGICFRLFCCGKLYIKRKLKLPRSWKWRSFLLVVLSPLTNRFSSSTLDRSLIYYYPHCPTRVFGRHFEKKITTLW